MQQMRSTTFPRLQSKERQGGTNNDKTNVIHEPTDGQAKKNCNRGNVLDRPVEKLGRI